MNPDDTVYEFRCDRCGSLVMRFPAGAASVLTLRWPQDLEQARAVLKAGLGAMSCPDCGHPVQTDGAHLLILGEGSGVLGLPDHWPRDAVEDAIRNLRKTLRDLTVCDGRAAFRRQLIEHVMGPAARLLREYELLPMSRRGEWLTLREDQLDLAFFATLWLTGHGGLQIYTAPITPDTPADGPVFIPKELAPDQARNVRANDEAARGVRRRAGELLANLLLYRLIRSKVTFCLEPLATLASRIPEQVLKDAETFDELTSIISGVSEQMEKRIDEPGHFFDPYLLEAGLALLCDAHGTPNPRQASWSGWFVRFDLFRRLSQRASDERLLPPVEQLRSTLDPVTFWEVYHAHSLQFLKQAGEDEDPAEQRKVQKALIDAAEHVYPGELYRQIEHRVHANEARELAGRDDTMALAREAVEHFLTQGRDGPLAHLCSRLEHPVAQPLLVALADRSDDMSGEDQLAVLRSGIEHLKEFARPDEAEILAMAGLALLKEATEPDEGDALDEAEAGRPDAISDQAQGRFLNEVGNILRLRRRLEEAEACYRRALKLLGGGLESTSYRVGLRNVGIVLREQHRYREAMAIFTELIPWADPTTLRGLLTSQGLCLLEMGRPDEARALLRRYANLIEGQSATASGVLEFVTLLSFLLADTDERDRAHRIMKDIVPVATRANYQAALILARDFDLQGAGTLADHREILERQMDVLEQVARQPVGTIVLACIHHVVDRLEREKAHEAAQAFLRSMADAVSPESCPRGWQLRARAAISGTASEHPGSDAGDRADDLDQALDMLHAGVAVAVRNGDLQDFIAPDASRLGALVAAALRTRTGDPIRDERRWRIAADALSAPALTARLLEPHREDGWPEHPLEREQRLADWLSATGGVLLQLCDVAAEVLLLRTEVDTDHRIRTRQFPLRIPTTQARRLASNLSYRLQLANAGAAELPHRAMRHWPALALAIDAALEDLPAGTTLQVVAGPLQETVVSLAIGDRFPLCFVPSLGAALALQANAPGAQARPSTLFAFAAWFDGEFRAPAAALAEVPAQLAHIAAEYQLEATHAVGVDATARALLDGLSAADGAWIACHGRVSDEQASVDLLVAAQGRLPPTNLEGLPTERREAYFVDWQDIAALPRTPSTVFSSACSSGVTFINRGGERLGLERALLPAGTCQFVAPLWPVPTVEMQRIVDHLIRRWLAAPEIALANHVQRTRAWCDEQGLPPLAGHALALFGLSSLQRT